jgi:predicted nucleic-acid-binding protein
LIGLDTNVLVRYFAQDDLKQSAVADRLMDSLTEEDQGWVGVATILELVWVMRSTMRFDRKGIITILSQLLTREEIVIEQSSIVESALQRFRRGNADFADCLIASSARAAGCSRTVTFDRVAARDAGMELLG